MKQEEKNQQSRERILRAAVAEFGTKGYDGASLNVLLSENGISKGLLYHYFQNKDQLYLSCVETCFDELTEVLSTLPIVGDAKRGIQAYFEVRARFFHEHPGLERIFFDALLQPPAHLEAELREAMAGFDRVNRSLFKDTLGSVRLPGRPVRRGCAQLFHTVAKRASPPIPFSGETHAGNGRNLRGPCARFNGTFAIWFGREGRMMIVSLLRVAATICLAWLVGKLASRVKLPPFWAG